MTAMQYLTPDVLRVLNEVGLNGADVARLDHAGEGLPAMLQVIGLHAERVVEMNRVITRQRSNVLDQLVRLDRRLDESPTTMLLREVDVTEINATVERRNATLLALLSTVGLRNKEVGHDA